MCACYTIAEEISTTIRGVAQYETMIAQKYTEEMSIAYEIITYVSKVLYTARKEGGRHWYASNRLEIAYNHRCLLCYLFYRALTL
jgi:hypothetical protein